MLVEEVSVGTESSRLGPSGGQVGPSRSLPMGPIVLVMDLVAYLGRSTGANSYMAEREEKGYGQDVLHEDDGPHFHFTLISET